MGEAKGWVLGGIEHLSRPKADLFPVGVGDRSFLPAGQHDLSAGIQWTPQGILGV